MGIRPSLLLLLLAVAWKRERDAVERNNVQSMQWDDGILMLSTLVELVDDYHHDKSDDRNNPTSAIITASRRLNSVVAIAATRHTHKTRRDAGEKAQYKCRHKEHSQSTHSPIIVAECRVGRLLLFPVRIQCEWPPNRCREDFGSFQDGHRPNQVGGRLENINQAQ
jgi:hypothetical protein